MLHQKVDNIKKRLFVSLLLKHRLLHITASLTFSSLFPFLLVIHSASPLVNIDISPIIIIDKAPGGRGRLWVLENDTNAQKDNSEGCIQRIHQEERTLEDVTVKN